MTGENVVTLYAHIFFYRAAYELQLEELFFIITDSPFQREQNSNSIIVALLLLFCTG